MGDVEAVARMLCEAEGIDPEEIIHGACDGHTLREWHVRTSKANMLVRRLKSRGWTPPKETK